MASDDTPTPPSADSAGARASAHSRAVATTKDHLPVIIRRGAEAPPTSPTSANDLGRPVGADALTHELANLVDASMRHLSLALGRIRTPDDPLETCDPHALRQLEAASEGLRHIATLLERWRGDQREPAALYRRGRQLGDVIDAVAAMLRPAADTHDIELRLILAHAAAAIPAGPLFPVLYNAAQNGMEAILARRHHAPTRHAVSHVDGQDQPDTPLPDRVTLEALLEADDLIVRVTDTGVGLNRALLDEDGWPLAGVSTKSGGSGLGLAIARDVVQALGGRISLSHHVGPPSGARFEARLPHAVLRHAPE